MAQSKPKTRAAASATTCSICSEPVNPAFRPFCSKRCADVDLLRWLNGSYGIAGGYTDEDDERPPEPGSSNGNTDFKN